MRVFIYSLLLVAGVLTWSAPAELISLAMEAEHYTSAQGVLVQNWGTCVESIDGGDWIAFQGIHFLEGEYSSLVLNYSKSGGDAGEVEIRLDSIAGTLLATFTPQNTGPRSQSFKADSVSLAPAQGVHTLFLVFKGGSNICFLEHLRLTGTYTPGPDDARDYYVSAGGDDAGGGTIAKPFRTIGRAAAVMKPGSRCYIRGGIYRETVRPAYSGVAGKPLLFTSYNGEEVYISGAEPVTNWQPHGGAIFKAYHPAGTYVYQNWEVFATDHQFNKRYERQYEIRQIDNYHRQIFVDGEMVHLARCPNIDEAFESMHVTNYPQWQPQASPLLLPTKVYFQDNGSAGDSLRTYWQIAYDGVRPSCMVGKPDDFLKGAYYFTSISWWKSFAEVVSSSGDRFTVKMSDVYQKHNNSTGYFAGLYNLLDAPGEWFHANDTLYLWAPGGKNPNNLRVETKVRTLGFDLSGKSYIELRGLRFHATSLTMRNAQHCRIDQSHFKYVSHYQTFEHEEIGHFVWGLEYDRSDGRRGVYISGANNEFVNSTIDFSAGSGVIVDGEFQKVENCLLQRCNYAGTYDASIYVEGGVGHAIERNTLQFGGRSHLHIAGTGTTLEPAINRLKIRYNDFRWSGLVTHETGHIYTYGPNAKGTDCAYNWFRDQSGSLNGNIVLDNGGWNWEIHHNLFLRGEAIFKPQVACNLCMRNGETWKNIIWNNTFVDSNSLALRHWDAQAFAGTNNLYAYGDTAYWKFTDPANLDYSLRQGSPAIDAGITEVSSNYWQCEGGHVYCPDQNVELTKIASPISVTQFNGNSPDMGAYEYGSAPWARPGATTTLPQWNYPPAGNSAIGGAVVMRSVSRPSLAMQRTVLTISNAPDAAVQLYNLSGRRIGSWTVDRHGTLRLETQRFGRTVYLVRVQTKAKSSVSSLVQVR